MSNFTIHLENTTFSCALQNQRLFAYAFLLAIKLVKFTAREIHKTYRKMYLISLNTNTCIFLFPRQHFILIY
jgi:hypothetical protein